MSVTASNMARAMVPGVRLAIAACLLGASVSAGADEAARADGQRVAADSQAVPAADPVLAASADASNTVVASDSTISSDDSNRPDSRVTGTSSLDTVVVTGQSEPEQAKTLEEQKDIPVSISIVSGQELEQQDALNVTDIFKRLGNIQWNFGNPMTGSLSIRGITTAASGVTIDPSLGVTVDGVPYAYIPLASQLDYVDVGTISVARGPQGSTGGMNTSTGTITVNNNQPSFTSEAHGSLILGDWDAVVGTAVVGGPAIDDVLAWRAVIYRDQQQGPFNDSYIGNPSRNSWDNSDRTLGRVEFLLTPTDDLNVLFSVTVKPKGVEFTNGLTQYVQEPYYYADGKPTYVPNGSVSLSSVTNLAENKLTRSYFMAVDPNAYQNYLGDPVLEALDKGIQTAEYGGVLNLSWDLPFARFRSITGYENAWFQASNGTTEWNISSDGGIQSPYRQESEELSLASRPGGFVDYKSGVFYLQSSSDYDSRSLYGGDAGAYYATPSQYNALAANGAGLALMMNSLNDAYTQANSITENRTAAAFGQAGWHLAQSLTLTTGLRLTREDRQTSQNKLVTDDGFGANLDSGAYGGFNSSATGVLAAGNTPAQIAIANGLAQQYFNVATYSLLSPAQLAQVAAAKGVRSANIYTTGLYNTMAAQPYKGTLPSGNVALSYALDQDITGYISWQHGVKAGISQIAIIRSVPSSLLVAPERSNAYEVGLKGDYLHRSLVVNADIYLEDIWNFQQTVGLYDPVLSTQNGFSTYDSVTGNAPLVRATGLEVDAAYTGIKRLTLRLAADYNNAFYKNDIQIAQPVERGDLAPTTYDARGQTLSYAPHFTGNLSGEYALPVLGSRVFHLNFNYHYVSKFNSDASQSEYAYVQGYGLADFGIGIGREDRRFDVNLLMKNAFNTAYNVSQTWASYIPGLPRWYGIGFSATIP